MITEVNEITGTRKYYSKLLLILNVEFMLLNLAFIKSFITIEITLAYVAPCDIHLLSYTPYGNKVLPRIFLYMYTYYVIIYILKGTQNR